MLLKDISTADNQTVTRRRNVGLELQFYLLNTLSFGDVLVSNLYSGITETFQQISGVQAHQISSFISFCKENNSMKGIFLIVSTSFFLHDSINLDG